MNEIAFLIVWPASLIGCAIWAGRTRRRIYWPLAAALALVPVILGMLVMQRPPTISEIAAWGLAVAFPVGVAFFIARSEIVDGRLRAAVATAFMYYVALVLGVVVGVELGVLVP